MEYKIKVHFPECRCYRNTKKQYFIYHYSGNERKKITFENYSKIVTYLKDKNYSVCINYKTPVSNFNGGVILITQNPRNIIVQDKNNDEIEFSRFYNIDTLKYLLNNSKINEHKTFHPISVFFNLFGKNLTTKNFVLLCKEKQYNILSFPKGKRLLGEDSTCCAIRELYEETGLDISYNDEEQKLTRKELNINLPTHFNYQKFHFKIIII